MAGDSVDDTMQKYYVKCGVGNCASGTMMGGWRSGSGPPDGPIGKNDGLHYSITRKGNAFLRRCLYLAVENMAMHKASNAITEFHSKKKSSGLCHKAAATAACRKLLVTIWGMLRSGTFFER